MSTLKPEAAQPGFCRNPIAGETFSFRVGMVIKKFEGIEDVIHQYEKWAGDEAGENEVHRK